MAFQGQMLEALDNPFSLAKARLWITVVLLLSWDQMKVLLVYITSSSLCWTSASSNAKSPTAESYMFDRASYFIWPSLIQMGCLKMAVVSLFSVVTWSNYYFCYHQPLQLTECQCHRKCMARKNKGISFIDFGSSFLTVMPQHVWILLLEKFI